MRIAVEHRSQYRFTEPQARIVQMLRVRPSDTQDQTVVSWRIDVDCDARLRPAVDGFGNETTMLYADGPLEAMEISVTGEVLTTDGTGIVRSANEPLPPLFFLRATKRTMRAGELDDFAADAVSGTDDVLEKMHRLNLAFNERFEVGPVGRDRGFSAGAAFAMETAGPRELAHMFVTAARGLHIPARYVSGYRHSGEEGTACAPHAWAETHVEGLGWVAFDPSAAICADEHYVRVAVALDASGTAPILGQRIGAGEEELDVDVTVERLGETPE